VTRDIQQAAVNVDGDDATRDFCDLQREPAIPRAQIDDVHARSDPNLGEHASRIRPQRFPPTCSRHFRAFEKSRKTAAHLELSDGRLILPRDVTTCAALQREEPAAFP
jgi:hypothetical protein